jgi:thiamine pyrophosphate-dependent acetolactate synthase large subunit-like protein
MTVGRMDPADALRALRRVRRPTDVVITTMGSARDWMEQGTSPLDLIFVPSAMGHAPSMGLGIALAQPRRRVIVCNGDGSMLMNLGSLTTIAAAGAVNLSVLVFDNGVYEVTGAQPTPNAVAGVDFSAIARGCGIASTHGFDSNERWAASVESILDGRGPHVVTLRTAIVTGKPGPRSPGKASERAAALRAALAR